MTDFGAERIRDEVILIARILLALLFLIFGWGKLTDYSGTVTYMTQSGVPLPTIATLVAIVVEFFVAIAVILGVWTRPLAVVLALYTLASAFIGHPFWTMEGADRYANTINFYKNVSIMGGFFLLYVTGAGKYSIDARLGDLPGAPPLRPWAPCTRPDPGHRSRSADRRHARAASDRRIRQGFRRWSRRPIGLPRSGGPGICRRCPGSWP